MKKTISMVALSLMVTTALGLSRSDPYNSIKLPITLNSSDSIQQLTVPMPVIAGSRSPELSDIVITNAQGQTVPMAWIPVDAPLQARSHTLKAHALTQAAMSNNDYTQIQLNSDEVRINVTRNNPASNSAVVGALLDARALSADAYVTRITLDLQTPVGQIVPLTLEYSSDLQNWQALANTGVVQLAGDSKTTTLDISPTRLRGQYVRIRWPENIAVTLTEAQLSSQNQQTPLTAQIDWPLSAEQGGTFSAYLPAVVRHQPFVLHLSTAMDNTNIPVNIVLSEPAATSYAVDNIRPSAQTVLFRLTQNGQTITNSPIQLMGKNSARLSLLPPKAQQLPSDLKASIELPIRRVAFIASGSAPYTLHYAENTTSTTRPIASLLPNYQTGDADKLPVANISAESVAAVLGAHAEFIGANSHDEASQNRKNYGLWAVLIGGVLLLLGMVLVIMKQMKKKVD